MRAVDTNILARFILRDDERQALVADAVLRAPVWVSDTVLLELGWLLERKLKMDRAVAAGALSAVVELETVHVADRAMLLWAVERYRTGADWADMVHLIANRMSADAFVTLDADMARGAGPISPVPIETLG